jgi:hypothetical protein
MWDRPTRGLPHAVDPVGVDTMEAFTRWFAGQDLPDTRKTVRRRSPTSSAVYSGMRVAPRRREYIACAQGQRRHRARRHHHRCHCRRARPVAAACSSPEKALIGRTPLSRQSQPKGELSPRARMLTRLRPGPHRRPIPPARASQRWAKTKPPSTSGAGRCTISASTVKPAASSQPATRAVERRCT